MAQALPATEPMLVATKLMATNFRRQLEIFVTFVTFTFVTPLSLCRLVSLGFEGKSNQPIRRRHSCPICDRKSRPSGRPPGPELVLPQALKRRNFMALAARLNESRDQ